MEALSGSTLTIYDSAITNSGGIIEAVGSGSVVDLEYATISGGEVAASSGGTVESTTGTSTISGATITIDKASTFEIADGAGLNLDDSTV